MTHNTQEHLAARRILPVTEEELQRVVLNIHDGPVQKLFAALSQLNVLQSQTAQDKLTHAGGRSTPTIRPRKRALPSTSASGCMINRLPSYNNFIQLTLSLSEADDGL